MAEQPYRKPATNVKRPIAIAGGFCQNCQNRQIVKAKDV